MSSVSLAWAVGVTMAFIADIIGNVGVQILKKAHSKILKEEGGPSETKQIRGRHPSITSSIISASPYIQRFEIPDQFHEKLLTGSPNKSVNTKPIKKRKRANYVCDPLWITGTAF